MFEPFSKQKICLYYLTQRNGIKFVGYGGSAGGGKSFIGAFWLFSSCINNAGAVFVMGRRSLTNLKKTTFLSFLKVISNKEWGLGLNPEDYFKVNWQTNIVEFHNGSKIFLMDMAHQPSDPEYLRFGGLELDGAFVDESNECDRKALEILSSRIGRGITDLPTKLLETFNPSKNHVYTRFYQQWKLKCFDKHTIFIPALPIDNPHLSEEYIEILKTLPEVQRQRLLYGNFDYDDDDRALCSFDKINDLFTNTFIKEGIKRTTSDIALQGRDYFVIAGWNGLRVNFPIIKGKSEADEVEQDLKDHNEKTQVTRSNTAVDDDGLGSYLKSYMKGIVAFNNGSSPLKKKEYLNENKKKQPVKAFKNLKSQCAFKLAEFINQGLIYLDVPEDMYIVVGGKDRSLREVLIEELGQLKRDNLENDDQPIRLISKKEMKENLGRSPDFLDTLIMGMYWYVLTPMIITTLDKTNRNTETRTIEEKMIENLKVDKMSKKKELPTIF